MNSNSQIKIGAIISYFAIGFNIIAGLIYTPWMIRQIGKSDYGLYVLATAFLTYFVMDLGLGQTIARFIVKYRAEGDEEKVNSLLGLTSKLYLFIDLLILVTLVIVYFFLDDIFVKLTPTELDRFKIIYAITGFFSILSFPFMPLDGILIAYERFTVLKLLGLLSKVVLVALMTVFLLMGHGLFTLVAINAGIGIALIIIKLYYISKTTTVKINILFADHNLIKELLKFSLWITVIGVAQRLLINITPTILGIFSGTEQIAIFSIGTIFVGYFWTFADALNGLFLPRVSEISAKANNTLEITNLMIKVGRLQLFVCGLLLVGIMSLGKQFITLWMGVDFHESYYVVLLLVVPISISVTQVIADTFILVVNKLKLQAFLYIGASLVSVLVSILLASRFGAIGSAIGIFTAYILCHILGMNIVYWKVLRLDIPRFFRECYLKMLLPISLSILAGFLIQVYVPAHSLLTFFPKAALLGMVYAILMWSIGLNADEKKIIRSMGLKLFPSRKAL